MQEVLDSIKDLSLYQNMDQGVSLGEHLVWFEVELGEVDDDFQSIGPEIVISQMADPFQGHRGDGFIFLVLFYLLLLNL